MKIVNPCRGEPCLLIACLCARWCSSCQGWQSQFEAIAEHLPNPVTVWIDIDDDEHLLPDALDIVQMPMMLVAEADGSIVFFGAAEPRIGTLISLALSSAFPDALQPEGDSAIARELLLRVKAEIAEISNPTPH
jgi:thioredoxin 1